MLAPMLALAMMQNPPVPIPRRGAALYAACLADIRIMDKTSSAESDLSDANQCMDYMTGFSDAVELTTAPICIENASLGTLVRIYVTYMQAHPKMMDTEERFGVYGALSQAYLCPKK
jgi:hypothetical protein